MKKLRWHWWEQVYEKVKNIVSSSVSFGKSRKETNIWKKRSVFFDLPYWRNLDVRQRIDVMHVEKNVCDSIVGTLLNIQGSLKDGVKARLDLQAMGIREDLHPRQYGKRTYCPRLLILCLRMRNEAFEEIKLCGPIHLRWMYPIERSMKFLKGYVKNASPPKHQLFEICFEEAMEFCQNYLAKVRHIGLPKRRIFEGGRRGASVKSVDRDELSQVHLYILNNVDEVQAAYLHIKRL
ncbi:hypothetical protein K1719_035714 [Acacia pycnantha]|nr:hypothetical protein K1719_035714 [Acacia pycnantha]